MLHWLNYQQFLELYDAAGFGIALYSSTCSDVVLSKTITEERDLQKSEDEKTLMAQQSRPEPLNDFNHGPTAASTNITRTKEDELAQALDLEKPLSESTLALYIDKKDSVTTTKKGENKKSRSWNLFAVTRSTHSNQKYLNTGTMHSSLELSASHDQISKGKRQSFADDMHSLSRYYYIHSL